MTYSYPIFKKYIALSITNQGTMEIAIVKVAPLGYIVDLYIDGSVEKPHTRVDYSYPT